eukprot:762550-Hanusia_phi.AAC.3
MSSILNLSWSRSPSNRPSLSSCLDNILSARLKLQQPGQEGQPAAVSRRGKRTRDGEGGQDQT